MLVNATRMSSLTRKLFQSSSIVYVDEQSHDDCEGKLPVSFCKTRSFIEFQVIDFISDKSITSAVKYGDALSVIELSDSPPLVNGEPPGSHQGKPSHPFFTFLNLFVNFTGHGLCPASSFSLGSFDRVAPRWMLFALPSLCWPLSYRNWSRMDLIAFWITALVSKSLFFNSSSIPYSNLNGHNVFPCFSSSFCWVVNRIASKECL